MPLIKIKTMKKYEEAKRIEILEEMDQKLIEKLELEKSRFLISLEDMDSTSYLFKGVNTRKTQEEYPLVQIYSMEGKTRQVEKAIMDTIIEVLGQKTKAKDENITIVFHQISSGNLYAGGKYLT